MLRAVVAAGSEARWVPFGGSVSTPPLLVAELVDQRHLIGRSESTAQGHFWLPARFPADRRC